MQNEKKTYGPMGPVDRKKQQEPVKKATETPGEKSRGQEERKEKKYDWNKRNQ